MTDKIEQVARALAFEVDGWHGWKISPEFQDQKWAEWPDEDQAWRCDEGCDRSWPGRNHYRKAAEIVLAVIDK